ncbi:MAG: response regulator [Desulfobacterales bacterium]|nr:response regulator [Desulfobacterales bacterium]
MVKELRRTGQSERTAASRRGHLEQERINLLHKQSWVGILASVVNAFLLAYLLRAQIAPELLAAWLAAVILLSTARALLVYYFPRHRFSLDGARRWAHWNIASLAISGILWGAGAWLLFPIHSVLHQVFLIVVLYGMVAGAAMAFAAMLRAFFAYSIPTTLALCLRLLTLPDAGEVHFFISLISLLFWGLTFLVAGNYRRTRLKLLQMKEHLADRVVQRTAELEKTNARLKAENRHRIRMEEQLRQERDRLETITGNIGAGLAVISLDYKILWANRVLKAIFGEVEGRSCFDTVYKDIAPESCNARQVLADGYEKAIQEHAGHDAQGNPIWSQTITTPIRDGGGRVTAALELVLPITDLKKAQEEKQSAALQLEEARKLEAVATLAGGMAHQFNNALAVIMGNAELLRYEGNHTERILRFVDPILQAATQMTKMTGQLLAYAKGGKYKAKPTPLHAFVAETLALLEHTIPANVSVASALACGQPFVKMDVTQMQMVLSAIMANAVEALTQGGRILVACRPHKIEASQSAFYGGVVPGAYVALSVSDEGIGMDAQTLQRIFEPFFTTKFQGRGLGMAAVYGIVRNHGGHVAIASQPGQGTQVTLYLPETEAPRAAAAAKPQAPPKANGTVLLVEDEPLVLEVNERILKRLGYQVVTACNGREALDHLGNSRTAIDAVLLDIKLPDMDGAALYPASRERRPDAKVIVCSGYALDGPTQALMDAGADGFLQKPFSLDDLARKLSAVLPRH